MRCAFTADFLNPNGKLVYQDIGLGVLDQASVEYEFFTSHAPVVSPGQLDGFDVVISLSPQYTASSLAGVENRLLAIVRFGVGYDMVDLEACTNAGVAVCITRGAVNRSVAEATMTWMLALSHRIIEKDRLVREGRWAERSNYMGSDLRCRTLGLIGAGGIGRRLVELLAGFGMNQPLVFDPYLTPGQAQEIGVQSVELGILMSEADFISVNCPLSEKTRGMIGWREIALMKPSAFLINTARGGIVDEAALADALHQGRIAGAASDVFQEEPAGRDHRFANLDNILLAPHCISWTDDLFSEIGHMAADAVSDLCHGHIPKNLLVNPKVLESPLFQMKLAAFKSRP